MSRLACMHRSAHGCRKIAATRAADNGATVAQLNAIFGWTGTAMASLYTEAADRKRLALEAMAMMAGQRTKMQHLFPHLASKCGHQSEKRNEIKGCNF